MKQRIEKEGDPNCNHEFIYSNMVVATNPPISHKICKKCGRVVEESDELIITPDSYGQLFNKFHT